MMIQGASMAFTGQDLLDAWKQLRNSQPRLRIREAAQRLNVSEAELLYASQGERVVRLRPDWEALFAALPSMGTVMALTRNEHCVHERYGVYDNISLSRNGQMGLVLNGAIDLRFFMGGWASLFAVSEPFADGQWRRSLQIFDRHGQAVHKIYLTEGSHLKAWVDLSEALRDDSREALLIDPLPEPVIEVADADIDAQALRRDWSALQDTHHFFALLKRHGISRRQALRLGGSEWAERLPSQALLSLLQRCAESALEIMVFVGNSGCIQIHSGSIHRLRRVGEWFNVLDPEFNLHLRDAAISELWRVRKPTVDGIVTSIEAFDQHGELVVQLFGARKPGGLEQLAWRDRVESYAAL